MKKGFTLIETLEPWEKEIWEASSKWERLAILDRIDSRGKDREDVNYIGIEERRFVAALPMPSRKEVKERSGPCIAFRVIQGGKE